MTQQTTQVAPEEILTVRELARMLRVNPRTIYNWRKEGYGPRVVRVRGVLRWIRSEVDRFLKEEMEKDL